VFYIEDMLKDSIVQLLKKHLQDLKRRFHVSSLFIFGSIARGEEKPDSDLDILVSFDGPSTVDAYMDLKFFLEDLLKRKVDLVTEKGVSPRLKAVIEKDLIRVS
jgi:predicted nucleotidyltransferase